MSIGSTDIVFLIGAGASADANIPVSAKMIEDIEELLRNDGEWGRYRDLYHHVRSAIHYAAGLKGNFEKVPYNIETLVNTLHELERNEEHPLYPFIAAWNSRFVALAGGDFGNVRLFLRHILQQLKTWMSPDDTSAADYYRGFISLQARLNYPLRVFSLNYDLCIERLSIAGFRVESGFPGLGPKHPWDWERFEPSDAAPSSALQLFLYKLHGSINWKRDAEGNLFCVDQIENVKADQMEVIFGREFKLEAADPYLFYAYEFRRFTLLAKLIVTIGYGFGDSHINKMLLQALRDDGDRKLLAVSRCKTNSECEQKASEVAGLLGVASDQVVVAKGTTKAFLEQANLADTLLEQIPVAKDSPF